jgi:hypothetical protein
MQGRALLSKVFELLGTSEKSGHVDTCHRAPRGVRILRSVTGLEDVDTPVGRIRGEWDNSWALTPSAPCGGALLDVLGEILLDEDYAGRA